MPLADSPIHPEHHELFSSGVRETPSWLDTFSKNERDEVIRLVRRLSVPSTASSMGALLLDYVTIGAAIALFQMVGSWLIYPVVVVVIGARQHGLLVLMHEASHFRLLKNRRWNDRLASWFCAWPFFASLTAYRRSHLDHHNHLNTARDPDWQLKAGRKEWNFPQTPFHLGLMLGGQFLGCGLLDQIRRLMRFCSVRTSSARRKVSWPRVIYYLIAALIFSVTGCWKGWLLFWVLPFCTYLPFVLRLRSIAEHFALPRTTEFSKSRHVNANALERFLFAPHHIWCHTAHHLFPSVPFGRLPELHRSLCHCPSYRDKAHINTGYLFARGNTVWRDLIPAA